jgi:hypothetical protein
VLNNRDQAIRPAVEAIRLAIFLLTTTVAATVVALTPFILVRRLRG